MHAHIHMHADYFNGRCAGELLGFLTLLNADSKKTAKNNWHKCFHRSGDHWVNPSHFSPYSEFRALTTTTTGIVLSFLIIRFAGQKCTESINHECQSTGRYSEHWPLQPLASSFHSWSNNQLWWSKEILHVLSDTVPINIWTTHSGYIVK